MNYKIVSLKTKSKTLTTTIGKKINKFIYNEVHLPSNNNFFFH